MDDRQRQRVRTKERLQRHVSNEEALSDDGGLLTKSTESREDIHGVRGRGEKRTRYLTNHCKGIVLDIEMPATAPEKDSTCTNKRIVRIFCEDPKTIWLASNDAGWTMKYIQHQLGSTGVLVVAGTVPGPGRPPPQSLPFTPPLQFTDEGTSDAGSPVE